MPSQKMQQVLRPEGNTGGCQGTKQDTVLGIWTQV
jgi:hypothetical protein